MSLQAVGFCIAGVLRSLLSTTPSYARANLPSISPHFRLPNF
ncbi:hypothetical protein [uncultured Nostoc sp.]